VTTSKERILDASAELFGRQGYAGTGVKQIVATANAPFGSLYHFFPGGKEQLGAEVIRWSGAIYLQLLDAVFDPAPDVVTAVRDFFAGAAETLRETDYADACPIATVALEVASTSEPLRRATAEVFESWVSAAAARLAQGGVAPNQARELAVTFLALLEGAFILSRASRSTKPVEIAGVAAAEAVRSALAGSASTPAPRARRARA
jgi:AcrR family transcriptional regulator